jgi:hypothetical protein
MEHVPDSAEGCLANPKLVISISNRPAAAHRRCFVKMPVLALTTVLDLGAE